MVCNPIFLGQRCWCVVLLLGWESWGGVGWEEGLRMGMGMPVGGETCAEGVHILSLFSISTST